jgi:hypothetical protein
MKRKIIAIIALLALGLGAASAQTLTDEQKAKVDALLKSLQTLGTDPTVVNAVKSFNANQPADTVGMTQDKWDKLSVLDPIVRGLSKNALAEYLKTKQTPIIIELFVSGANGTKVAFFGKTTSWSHTGKPKHDVPMTGKTWVGAPAVDESTGKMELQFSFPVLDAGKPIGSIVIGLDVSKL